MTPKGELIGYIGQVNIQKRRAVILFYKTIGKDEFDGGMRYHIVNVDIDKDKYTYTFEWKRGSKDEIEFLSFPLEWLFKSDEEVVELYEKWCNEEIKFDF